MAFVFLNRSLDVSEMIEEHPFLPYVAHPFSPHLRMQFLFLEQTHEPKAHKTPITVDNGKLFAMTVFHTNPKL